LTGMLLAHLRGEAGLDQQTVEVDPRTDDDLHLALYLCYQLHYGGLGGGSDDLEWDPALRAFRDVLGAAFAHALLADVGVDPPPDARSMVDQLQDVVRRDSGPSVAGHLQRDASLE